MNRWPRAVYGLGDEPDPRFSLANERTALAWTRTALAFLAGSVALISLASVASMPVWLPLLAIYASILSAVIATLALIQWGRTERALRLQRPLPSSLALPVVVVGVVVLALAIGGVALVESLGAR